jgi:hypothetical protein
MSGIEFSGRLYEGGGCSRRDKQGGGWHGTNLLYS